MSSQRITVQSEPVMMEKLRFLGMDVQAETIAVAIAVAEPDGEVQSLGTIPNRSEPIRKLINKLGLIEKVRVSDEAGQSTTYERNRTIARFCQRGSS